MGCPDYVLVKCPKCGTKNEFQSKGGECMCNTYELEEAPADVLSDINRHAPVCCSNCGTPYSVKLQIIAIPTAE